MNRSQLPSRIAAVLRQARGLSVFSLMNRSQLLCDCIHLSHVLILSVFSLMNRSQLPNVGTLARLAAAIFQYSP